MQATIFDMKSTLEERIKRRLHIGAYITTRR